MAQLASRISAQGGSCRDRNWRGTDIEEDDHQPVTIDDERSGNFRYCQPVGSRATPDDRIHFLATPRQHGKFRLGHLFGNISATQGLDDVEIQMNRA